MTGQQETVYYSKIPDHVVDRLDMASGWLLVVVTRHMDRTTNRLRVDLHELARLAGMSRRKVVDCIKALEAEGLLAVRRRRDPSSKRAQVNVYSLAGKAKISLWPGAGDAPGIEGEPGAGGAPKNLTRLNEIDSMIDTPILEQESAFEGIEEPAERDEPGPGEFVAPVVHRVLHADARKFLREHGAPRVEAACVVAEARATSSTYGYAVKVLETPPPTPSPFTPPLAPPHHDGEGNLKSMSDYSTQEADVSDSTEEDRNPYLERLARLRAEGAIPAPSNGAVSGPVWWQMAYNQLRLQFDADQWSRWLKDMAYVDHEDGLIRIKVRTLAQREVVQYRLARNVRRVIADCIGCGMHEVEIEVVVEEVGR